MKKDKLKSYIFEIIICIILFFALFVPNVFTRIVLAILITIFTIIVNKILQTKRILSIYHKQATILMGLLGVAYLAILYLLGLYFGYYDATIKFSGWSLINFTIPTAVIIISSEVMRSVFLTKKSNISKVLATIPMILIDLIVYTNIYQITTFDGFVYIMSFSVFASIASNLLYNYISVRYGYKPIIVFRLFAVLYTYIIPILPDLHMIFRCFLRIVYPYIIYLIFERAYSKNNFSLAVKDKRKDIIITVITLILLTLIIMLISCNFKYGILVIGSKSMTGTINKGDAILFEAYSGQEISEGQVIIFRSNNMDVIHRVIDIKISNEGYRYYTKGDANQQADSGYITSDEIIGITKLRLMYIGYPTIWLREIFTKT